MWWLLLVGALNVGQERGFTFDETTNRDGIVINFVIKKFSTQEKFVEGERFTDISISGAGIIYETGKPKLPVIRKLVEVPEGATLSLEAKVDEVRELSLLYPIYPNQMPWPKIPGYKPEFAWDKEYYQRDEFLPKLGANLMGVSEIRGRRVAMIEIYPISYNPAQNIVKFASNIRVRIKFIGADWKKTADKLNRYSSPIYEKRLKNIIVNYNSFVKEVPPLPIGYLIITPDAWQSTITPLAEWKKQKGYYVKVANITEVGGGDTATVRSYIKNAYDTWAVPPTFVLLVGDVDKLGYYVGLGADNPATDLYYSTMTPGDYFPDIDVARFSVANATQLAELVDKVIRYEKNNWTQGVGWCEKAYFIASSDGWNHQVAEETHLYCMQIARAYGMVCDSIWLYYGTGTPITTAINDGRSWVMYSGHGNYDQWADPGFTVSDVYSLTNTDKVPFVGTFACLSGDYSYPQCFSEAWLRVGRKGAIAHWASSVTSYWEEDDILQRRIFDAAFDTGSTWVMGLINKGKLLYFNHYGNIPMTRRYFEMYNLIGDGSIDIYWDQPHTITVEYQPVIPVGQFNLEVTVKDDGAPVKDALVCASRDTIFVGYTDATGKTTLVMNNPIPCSLQITVTGHNLGTYIGSCQAIAAGTYVVYYKHSIDDDNFGASSGNADGIVDAGEIIELPIWVKNWGSNIAYGVEGILSTSDTFVTITTNSATFENIPPGDSALSSIPYVVEISPYTPDSHWVTFNLTCKNLDSTWVSHFSVLIKHYIGVALISPNGGEEWLGLSVHAVTWEKVGIGFDSYRLLYSLTPDSLLDTAACSISSPHPYPNQYDNTWVIGDSGAQKITIHFSNFETEATYDFVYLYDKYNNQIARYDGNLGTFWAKPVPGDTVKIRLTSDWSVTGYGFDIDKYAVVYPGEGYKDTIAKNISPDSSYWNWTLPNVACTTARVKVEIIDPLGEVIVADESDAYFTIIKVGTEEASVGPRTYKLSQVYPNPVDKKVVIKYQLPVEAEVALRIYDIGGRLVKTLVDEKKAPGYYKVVWDRKDNMGNRLPCGIYFYRMETNNFTATKKLIIIR